MHRQGKWPKCPEGIEEKCFHDRIRAWVRIEEYSGVEALRHKAQNKVWSAEEKYELVAKVMAGASYRSTAFQAGIDHGLLRQWTRMFKIKG